MLAVLEYLEPFPECFRCRATPGPTKRANRGGQGPMSRSAVPPRLVHAPYPLSGRSDRCGALSAAPACPPRPTQRDGCIQRHRQPGSPQASGSRSSRPGARFPTKGDPACDLVCRLWRISLLGARNRERFRSGSSAPTTRSAAGALAAKIPRGPASCDRGTHAAFVSSGTFSPTSGLCRSLPRGTQSESDRSRSRLLAARIARRLQHRRARPNHFDRPPRRRQARSPGASVARLLFRPRLRRVSARPCGPSWRGYAGSDGRHARYRPWLLLPRRRPSFRGEGQPTWQGHRDRRLRGPARGSAAHCGWA
jgi:hypothetical protein